MEGAVLRSYGSGVGKCPHFSHHQTIELLARAIINPYKRVVVLVMNLMIKPF
jgi:hypothetical protein